MATKDEARKFLSDVASESSFWVNNGPILKNLDELSNFMQAANEDTFKHHVNADKNDFSNWINNIIGDKKLANDLLSSKTKDSMIKKVNNRLNSLKKKAG